MSEITISGIIHGGYLQSFAKIFRLFPRELRRSVFRRPVLYGLPVFFVGTNFNLKIELFCYFNLVIGEPFAFVDVDVGQCRFRVRCAIYRGGVFHVRMKKYMHRVRLRGTMQVYGPRAKTKLEDFGVWSWVRRR